MPNWEPGETNEIKGDTALDVHRREINKRHSNKVPWKCVGCGYTPNVDVVSENCMNCGRNWIGEDGPVPEKYDKDPRPGLRDDVEF